MTGATGLNGAMVVARHSLQEAVRRKVFAVVLGLTAVFGLLYAWGCDVVFGDVASFAEAGVDLDAESLAGSTILGLAMFGTLFLGAVLAVFLTVNAVRGDAERGLLQPIVVRPISRSAYLTGRFLGAAAVSGGYTLCVFLGAVLVTGAVSGWWPEHPLGAGIRLAGAVVVITALATVGSVFLSSTANGIGILMIYGAGLLAGLIGEIGDAVNSETLEGIADTASWILPFEMLYRDALRLLVQDVPGLAGAIVELGPLGGSHDAGPLLVPWAAGYTALVLALAALRFQRQDL
jgi:ABC-type transport system involved in multi-copper enzyme maturation permease subunit